ncbi:MAG TPA: hypothetical protein PLW44_18105 [Chitinophagales bacterium]|nr:hypothetical protein [Chitinophagales bacterium]
MNTTLFYISFAELGLSLLIGVLVLFLTQKTVRYLLNRNQQVEVNNLAATIFVSSVLFSTGYIISGCVQPVINSFRALSNSGQDGALLIFNGLRYTAVFVLIGMLVAGIANTVTFYLYSSLTKGINELDEIRNNNTQVAVIVAVILVVICLFVKDGYVLMIESLVPRVSVTFN